MATLTLGKSVTTDAVRSKKGDAVFVERRRRVVAPNSKELRDEPVAPVAQKNAADEKLRAVLAAAKAREEERKKREAEEEAARAARAAEIERENREYEQVKSQLAARENVAKEAEVAEEPVKEEITTVTETETEVVVSEADLVAQELENLDAGLCNDGSKPNQFGCCSGEVYKDLGDFVYACCPKTGGDCFPPII